MERSKKKKKGNAKKQKPAKETKVPSSLFSSHTSAWRIRSKAARIPNALSLVFYLPFYWIETNANKIISDKGRTLFLFLFCFLSAPLPLFHQVFDLDLGIFCGWCGWLGAELPWQGDMGGNSPLTIFRFSPKIPYLVQFFCLHC